MNAKIFISPQFNLLEKKNFASRIACTVFFILALMYIYGGQPTTALVITLMLMATLVFQFIFQINAINGSFGGLLFLLSAYLSLAVWSEFCEFEVVTHSARQLLIVGWGGCFIGAVLSGLMILSFIRDF